MPGHGALQAKVWRAVHDAAAGNVVCDAAARRQSRKGYTATQDGKTATEPYHIIYCPVGEEEMTT